MKKLDKSQQSAVDNISKLTSRVYLLIGAGGSGKTFTIQHLLEQFWAAEEKLTVSEGRVFSRSLLEAEQSIYDFIGGAA
jgi:type II secretory ATPase GspE/PulE/Tfp pilus assembly ATPase PilB-like protein